MARQIAGDVFLYALAILALGVAVVALGFALADLACDLYRALRRLTDRAERDLPDASDDPREAPYVLAA